jgi:hypothetical protein
VKTYDDLLFNGDLKLIQTRITDFLIHMQGEQNLSPATVSYYFVAIRFFYKMNDVIAINWEKFQRYCLNLERWLMILERESPL